MPAAEQGCQWKGQVYRLGAKLTPKVELTPGCSTKGHLIREVIQSIFCGCNNWLDGSYSNRYLYLHGKL